MTEWLTSVWLRLKSARKRAQLDRDLEEEMAFHLAMRAEKLRTVGVRQDEAPYAARRAFGNVTGMKETTRMLWTFQWVEELGQDVKYAMRSLKKNRTLAAVVVLSLALGIGANTAIFSLIDAVMLRLLPVRNPGELMVVQRRMANGDHGRSVTNPLWEAVRDSQDVFSGVFAWGRDRFDMAQGGAVQYANAIYVSGGFFGTLGVRPVAGRLIAADDDRRGCPSLAVLSYGFWQSHYGGAQNAIGTTMSLDHQPFQVIGVSAPGFTGVDVGESFDVAVPICSSQVFDGAKSRLDHRSWWWLSVMGRVKPGLSQDQVTARLEARSSGILEAAVPLTWQKKDQDRFLSAKIVAEPAAAGVSRLRRQFAEPLRILMGIVGVVLLIACANIASLLLARANARGREIGIRRALGASRWRLVRQLLTESVLLSTLGALAGLLVARWGSALLVRNLGTQRSAVSLDLAMDGRVLGFTAAVAFITGVLIGLLPAIKATRVSLFSSIKTGESGAERGARFRTSKWIVGMQVALSLVLLIGGGLLLRTFSNLVRQDAGFDRNGVLLTSVNLQTSKLAEDQWGPTYEAILSRLQALPGVTSVSRSFNIPLSGWMWNNDVHSDSPNAPTGEAALVYFNFVSPKFFNTLGMRMVAGRDFDNRDTSTSNQVAIVNETMARQFFPGMNAIGSRFQVDKMGTYTGWIEVVGIVKDAKYESLREVTPATAFFPATQIPGHDGREVFALRTTLPAGTMSAAVQSAVAEVNKDISLECHTLAAQVDDTLVEERLLATLSGLFGALALVLAMIGVYGVLSYLVGKRQGEFGIRMALGAQRGSILGLVMRDVAIVLAGGLAAGLAIALGTVTMLQKMLFGLAPRDAATMALSVAVLCAMAALAGYLPARRATHTDPLVALRHE